MYIKSEDNNNTSTLKYLISNDSTLLENYATNKEYNNINIESTSGEYQISKDIMTNSPDNSISLIAYTERKTNELSSIVGPYTYRFIDLNINDISLNYLHGNKLSIDTVNLGNDETLFYGDTNITIPNFQMYVY